ncbi:MAG: fructose-6-phosphate aldolase [Vampirovibrionales bacterium]
MQLFVDTADLDEIKEAARWGVVTGVTTNPTLLAKSFSGKEVSIKAVIQEICGLVDGPISMEVTRPDAEGMIAEGREFASWHPNVYVKIPFGIEGMKAVKVLTEEGISTNVTLVFSANQALLAANAGATLISSFVGRVDDVGYDGIGIIEQVVNLMSIHGFQSLVLAASIRHPLHVTQSAEAGADIATIPFKVLKQMYHHPLTESGIAAFNADVAKLAPVAV